MYSAFHTHVKLRLGLIFDSHILMHGFLQRFSSHGETKRPRLTSGYIPLTSAMAVQDVNLLFSTKYRKIKVFFWPIRIQSDI